ncbi:MAG: EF-hand domain-containing protein, partial [Verrucomicrobiaceae bacterium]
MKSKLLIITAATAILGSLSLNAQDAAKPPGQPGDGGQQSRLDEMLKKIDTNGDGKISKEEWLEFSKKEAEDRYAKMDSNSDGSVDKAEMEEGARKMREARGQGGEGRTGGFRRPEAGEGGTRNRPEGGTANPQPGAEGAPQRPATGGMGGGLRDIMKKIEENGSISKEEFGKMNAEQFDKMDLNHDGKITKEEMDETMKKMREMFGGRGQGGAGGQGAPQGSGRTQGGPDA